MALISQMVLAVDPGPKLSAYVLWDGSGIVMHGKVVNELLLEPGRCGIYMPDNRAIEMIASYGMAVGADVFETCIWIGRYLQAWGGADRVFRRDVKLHLCANPRAKDGNVRQALIDRLGAPGTKRNPGATYGITKDRWQALALAVTWWDAHQRESAPF